MSQPRINNIRSFADVNYEVDWIHKNLTQLSNLLNQETTETLNFTHLSCYDLKITSQADNAITNSGGISSKTYISQSQGYRINANGDADFRYLYTDELHAKAFIADLEQALAGGQIISKSVAKIAREFTIPSAGNSSSLFVEEFMGFTGQVFADGDMIRLRQFTRSSNTTVTVADVWGTVVYTRRWPNGISPSAGNTPLQQYVFTRSAAPNAGTGTGTIAKGTLALDYGVSGQGYYEVTAIDGANGANSPYAQCVTWTTHPQSGCTVRTRFGNLAGITSDTWGALTGYGLYGDNVYLEGDCYIKGAITFTNQGSIAISGFNNDSGFITIASAPQSFYGTTEPTVVTNGLKVGDFWFDTNTGVYKMKRCATITPSVTWNNIGVYMDANGVYAGNITAGQVTAGTFTGFTFQTDDDGKRVVISDADDITFYDSGGDLSGVISGSALAKKGVSITSAMLIKSTKNPSIVGFDTNVPTLEFYQKYLTPPSDPCIHLIIADYSAGGDYTHTLPTVSGTILTTGNYPTATNIGASTVGGNIFSLTNPSAITFLRMNADNSVSALSAGDFVTAIGAAPSTQGAAFSSHSATSGRYVATSSGGSPTTQMGWVVLTINGVSYTVFTSD